MRAIRLTLGEMRFLWKYGVIPLYALFTLFYICLLQVLPLSAKPVAAALLIFTDPAAMGLFFMGAVLLLEKSQRVNASLAVSPIRVWEYIIAKVLPMTATGTLVGLVICAASGLEASWLTLWGVALASVLFSLCGLFAATKAPTLNGFLIAVIPFEAVICAPALFYLFGFIQGDGWLMHPGIAAIRLIAGQGALWGIAPLSLLLWSALAFVLCRRAVTLAFTAVGGGNA